jgi:TonB family protein
MLRVWKMVTAVVAVGGLAISAETPVAPTTHGATKPKLIHSALPKLPPHGYWFSSKTVTVEYTVGIDGHTHNIHIVKSKGKQFDFNAMVAVAYYRYEPATKDGVPVSVAVKHGVDFVYGSAYNDCPACTNSVSLTR